MKKIFTIIVITLAALVPLAVHADVVPSEQVFLMQFHVHWVGGQPSARVRYDITTGDTNLPPVGDWQMQILSGNGTLLAKYPMSQVQKGDEEIIVPYEPRGVTMRITDDVGAIRETEDLSGSRVCNDDGYCNGGVGEDSFNCPTDCGKPTAEAPTTITAQADIGNQLVGNIGGILASLAAAAAGLFILGSAVRIDRHRRP